MSILNNLLELFFPRLCICCQDRLNSEEKHICISCLYNLPRTDHLVSDNNKLEDFFAGRFPFERIASFAYFVKGGSLQKVIHELKYHNNPKLGIFIGNLCGKEISRTGYAENIDIIVPVPLHKKRLHKRGYNQSLMIAEGIAEIIGKPIQSDNLIRRINNPSQTKNSRYERWINTEGIFETKDPSLFQDKHILLVDDVVTTGSTLEVCAKLILNSENSRISIFTVGSAI